MYKLPEYQLLIHEITAGNTGRLEAMLDLFVTYYPEYTYYAPRIRETAQLPPDFDPDFIQHQWLAEIGGRPAGMTIFKYVPKRNCGLGLDLAVHPDFRKTPMGPYCGLAEFLSKFSVEQLKVDAKVIGRPVPYGLLAEVEHPQLIAHYEAYGFIAFPVDYAEPPYILKGTNREMPPKEDFHPMHLGIFPTEGKEFDPTDPVVLIELVSAFIIDHYGLPRDHWVLRQALNSIGHS